MELALSLRVRSTFRLGEVRDDGTPPSLFTSSEQAEQVLRRSWRLKDEAVRLRHNLSDCR